jgi:hypothetical protein
VLIGYKHLEVLVLCWWREKHSRQAKQDSRSLPYPTKVFTALVRSASAVFASAKYMLVLGSV